MSNKPAPRFPLWPEPLSLLTILTWAYTTLLPTATRGILQRQKLNHVTPISWLPSDFPSDFHHNPTVEGGPEALCDLPASSPTPFPLSVPTAHFSQPHRPLCLSSSAPSMAFSLYLCSCCSLSLDCSSPQMLIRGLYYFIQIPTCSMSTFQTLNWTSYLKKHPVNSLAAAPSFKHLFLLWIFLSPPPCNINFMRKWAWLSWPLCAQHLVQCLAQSGHWVSLRGNTWWCISLFLFHIASYLPLSDSHDHVT